MPIIIWIKELVDIQRVLKILLQKSVLKMKKIKIYSKFIVKNLALYNLNVHKICITNKHLTKRTPVNFKDLRKKLYKKWDNNRAGVKIPSMLLIEVTTDYNWLMSYE
jgi:hypothetical protein